MFRVHVRITLRRSILDPQGKAICHALHDLGMDQVDQVRSGKIMSLDIRAADEASAREVAADACKKLLANPVTEDFSVFEVESLADAEAVA